MVNTPSSPPGLFSSAAAPLSPPQPVSTLTVSSAPRNSAESLLPVFFSFFLYPYCILISS